MDNRAISLGDFNVLTDDLLSEFILQKLPAEDLGRCALVSRHLYVFSRDDQLWKRHCLDKWVSNKEVMTSFTFRGTWLLTYIFPSRLSDEEERRVSSHPLCWPLRLKGIQSRYLYAKWCRCNMFLGNFVPPPEALGRIAIENGEILSKTKFNNLYDAPSMPCLITNTGVEKWRAWDEWKLNDIVHKYGNKIFRVANERGGKVKYVPMTLASYLNYIRRQHDETPLYVFDPSFVDNIPEMGSAYQVSEYFQDDLFSVLQSKRPPYRWIIIGPERSGASWHVDPLGTSAWNTLISGRKRWALYPPQLVPPGMSISRSSANGHQSLLDDPAQANDSATSLFWYLEIYPQLTPELRPIEVLQEPGLYLCLVDGGIWHVLNLEDTVAVTQNFVNVNNLDNVCEDLLSESDNQNIWDDFSKNLTRIYPDLEAYIKRRISMYKDQTKDSIIKNEGFDTKMAFIESFSNTDVWGIRVKEACKKSGITVPEDITPIGQGQNPAFRFSRSIVKFYSHIYDGIESYKRESKAYSLIKANIHPDLSSYFANVLGHGYLYEESSEQLYSWPFMIFEAVEDSVSLADIIKGGGLSPQSEVDIDGKYGVIKWGLFTDRIAKILKGLHNIAPPTRPGSDINVPLFHDFINNRIKKAHTSHKMWLTFPPELIAQMPLYLPKSGPEIFDPAVDGFCAGTLHGDLNAENILGVVKCEDSRYDWIPTTVIDLGDAHINGGDPLFDVVSVYISALGCSKALLQRFLNAYGDGISIRMFGRRAMWYVLLWEFEGLSKYLVACMPQIRDCKNWEEVEELVWGL
ncbi:1324_t:CDS:10 [Paraglomus brasilianum]|uniref:1324_t:CDS:1 n=1 Tax=Paraglomus brasilianum TaxID=144538 RepID=A0A9N8Z898_9GLOM|nr:1324_t:CDS:10 [Paraglomus brasilianum]